MTQTHIVALGGSLLRPEEEEGRDYWFGRLRQLCVHVEGNGHHLGIVVGGGLPAREAISLAKPYVNDTHSLDQIGIGATRINATIIQQVLKETGLDVSPVIPHACGEAAELLEKHHIVVMGGTIPGHTTDAVAVEFATKAGAVKCIIATNVSHVYDKDPSVYPEAKKLENITLKELGDICGVGKEREAGQSVVVDPVAVERAIEAELSMCVLDGRDVGLLEAAIEGRNFNGTNITV